MRTSGWWLGVFSHSGTASGRGVVGEDVQEVDEGVGEGVLEEVGVDTTKESWAGDAAAAGGRL